MKILDFLGKKFYFTDSARQGLFLTLLVDHEIVLKEGSVLPGILLSDVSKEGNVPQGVHPLRKILTSSVKNFTSLTGLDRVYKITGG